MVIKIKDHVNGIYSKDNMKFLKDNINGIFICEQYNVNYVKFRNDYLCHVSDYSILDAKTNATIGQYRKDRKKKEFEKRNYYEQP